MKLMKRNQLPSPRLSVWLKLSYLWMILIVAACQALPNPRPIPTATRTAGPFPTATFMPSATPSPTPAPVVRIDSGDTALFNGDYDLARQQYQSAFDDTADNAVKAAALWGLGRTELADENYQAAIDKLTFLTTEYPDSTYAARAYFLLGQAYYKLQQYQQSADAYNTYLKRVPGVLDAYVQEYRGDALIQINDYADAISAYNAALSAPRLDDGLSVQIKIAQARASFGDHAGALTMYDQIFNATDNDYIKAQMDYLAGQSYAALSQTDKADEKYMNAVENYPLSYYAYLSLVELVNANVQVDEFERGLVDYYANQYDVALLAFDHYIKANPSNSGNVHYYRALTFQNLQRTDEAIQELSYFIKNYPDNPNWADAWKEKSFLQWTVKNDYTAAAQTLLDYVAAVPGASDASQFLSDAGRMYERNNDLEKAAQTWERVSNEYPNSEQSSTSLFWAGLTRYRLKDYEGALTIFNRNLLLSVLPEDQARADFWIGKTQKQLGDDTAAQEAWQQGQSIDNTEYYSLRSRDMLLGRGLFEAPTIVNTNPDMKKELNDAEVWMRITFNLPENTDLNGPGDLAQDPRFIRGTELWEMGMHDEARLEFESLRNSVSDNAVDSFRLGNQLLGIGLYRSAIFAIRQVLTLAGIQDHSDSLNVPPYFNHVRYGMYYHDLITTEAQQYGLDPLFMFSVVRQESLFEGFVQSTAGAHGLMQIIPATGDQIASELHWPPNYTSDDLYRPLVSIQFGSYYLAKNRDLLGGDLYAALAAYNGGPGNAAVWNQLAGGDPDLLVELIRFDETRTYIRSIYEIYNIYRKIYSPVQ